MSVSLNDLDPRSRQSKRAPCWRRVGSSPICREGNSCSSLQEWSMGFPLCYSSPAQEFLSPLWSQMYTYVCRAGETKWGITKFPSLFLQPSTWVLPPSCAERNLHSRMEKGSGNRKDPCFISGAQWRVFTPLTPYAWKKGKSFDR